MSHIIHTPTHTESHHNGSQPMSSASSTDTAAPTAEEFDLYKYMLHSIATAIYTQIQREDNNVADNRSVYERFKLPTFTLNGTVVNDTNGLGDHGEKTLSLALMALTQLIAGEYGDDAIVVCKKIGSRFSKTDVIMLLVKYIREQLYKCIQVKTMSKWDCHHRSSALHNLISQNHDDTMIVVFQDMMLHHFTVVYAGWCKGKSASQVFNDSTTLTSIEEVYDVLVKLSEHALIHDPNRMPKNQLTEFNAYRRFELLCRTNPEPIYVQQSDDSVSVYDGHWLVETDDGKYQAKHNNTVSGENLNTI